MPDSTTPTPTLTTDERLAALEFQVAVLLRAVTNRATPAEVEAAAQVRPA